MQDKTQQGISSLGLDFSGLNSFMPPQQTQSQIYDELQSIVAPSQKRSKDIAMSQALMNFGTAIGQTPGMNFLQGFTQAAPAFTQTLNKYNQAQIERDLKLQLAARQEFKEQQKETRNIGLKIATEKLKSGDFTTTTIGTTNPALIGTDRGAPVRGLKDKRGNIYKYSSEKKAYVPLDSQDIELSRESLNTYIQSVIANKESNVIKSADEGSGFIVDADNPNGFEIKTKTGPQLITDFIATETNRFEPVDNYYPHFNPGKKEDYIKETVEDHRTILSVIKPYKILDANGVVSVVPIGSENAKATTENHLKFRSDGSVMENYIDGNYHPVTNPEGTFYAEREAAIGNLNTTDKKKYDEALDQIQQLQRASYILDELIAGGTPMNLNSDAAVKLTGVGNALRQKIQNPVIANIGEFIGLGDDQVLSNDAVAKAKTTLEFALKAYVIATAASPRVPVYEQQLARDNIGADDPTKIFGDVTTVSKLIEVNRQIKNRLNEVRALISPEGTPIFKQRPVPSFSKSDPGMFNFTFVGDNVQINPNSDTAANARILQLVADLSTDELSTKDKVEFLKNKFGTVNQSTYEAIRESKFANQVRFKRVGDGKYRVNLLDLSKVFDLKL